MESGHDIRSPLQQSDAPGMVVHSVIPVFGRVRQEDDEFKASLG
jgi:hypothetical protein